MTHEADAPADVMAGAFAQEVARAGVRHAVVAPGSRSTPLVRAIARASGLSVHVVVDERSAAFVALGIGKATGAPALVVATSGTAAANFFPAIVEASYARVPLLALTADRPPELRDTGAGQTIDQLKLYGEFVRWFVEVGVADGHVTAGAYWRSLAVRAVHRARLDPAGPVHLNFAFREPLVVSGSPPDVATGPGGEAASARSMIGRRVLSEEDADELAAAVGSTRRGLIVAGGRELPGEALRKLARTLSFPLIADVLSGARDGSTITTYEALLRSPGFRADHEPDLVLQFGGITASRPLAELAGAAPRRILVDEAGAWGDPERNASLLVTADPADVCRQLMARAKRDDESAWLTSWRAAEERARTAIEEMLDGDELSEPRLARDVMRLAPDGATIAVSSSMPIRDLEWFSSPRPVVRILANRGANGIDGFISSATGMALGTGERVIAIAGDLAALHDQGALATAVRSAANLVVVVVNNDGGGIFSFLPQAALDDEFERLFATPQRADFGAIARAAGAAFARPPSPSAFEQELRAAVARPGVSVVEVRTDRDANVALHGRLWAAVDAALPE